jgi:hypothetical protein
MKMLNELAKEIHENAKAHGWWEEERSFGDIVALCHSELSEALEEYRNDKPMIYCNFPVGGMNYSVIETPYVSGQKPEGIAVEMADCIIRILDWCGKEGIDIDEIVRIKTEYNKTRPYRHGGKTI